MSKEKISNTEKLLFLIEDEAGQFEPRVRFTKEERPWKILPCHFINLPIITKDTSEDENQKV